MCKVFFIEGPDYSGKTTLIKNLSNYFKSNGRRVAIFREPDGEFRKMLLDKDSNLSFATRRALFAADHLQTLDTIYQSRDKYDYIFVDRCTIVSDLVYSRYETEDSFLRGRISDNYQAQYRIIDNYQYNNFFKLNSALVILKLPKHELLSRMVSRAIDKNDKFDIKGDDFKVEVWANYRDITEMIMNNDIKLHPLFRMISTIEVDDNILINAIDVVTEGERKDV